MRIPLIDLQAQYRTIKTEIDAAIARVVESGQFILGPEVEALEREIAAYCGTRYAVGVASGTDALELSLRALGIGPGDEVLTTAFSFFATAEVIVAVGATPRFVDLEPRTLNLDPAHLAAAITPRTKAVIPVHLYGHPCAMDDVMTIASTHRLAVIEDCAQAIGAEYHGRRVGSFGQAGALSFFPSKNLGGYGDGGMVVTNDAALAERVRLLRVHGSRAKYLHEVIGTNSRLDELQAAILRVKLRYLDQWTQARRRHARSYAEALQRNGLDELELPQELAGCTHVYHLYTIRHRERDLIRQALAKQGIASQIAYPSTLPSQLALNAWVPQAQRFPQAEAATLQVLSLPLYPELTPELIGQVVETLAAKSLDSPHRK